MAETVLKFSPQQDPPLDRDKSFLGRLRRRARIILLVLIPALAFVGGVAFYLTGGRYISTDNAYIGAQKVLITPDVSGKVTQVFIREGQHVAAGDPLFEIDLMPFQLKLQQAQSKVQSVRTELANLKINYQSLTQFIALAQQTVDLKRRDLERKTTLAAARAGTQVDAETANAALLTAELELQLGQQLLSTTLNQLIGNPNLLEEEFPGYQQAKAALDQAQRDLDHAVIKAPISGTATQVDNIQLGRFITAGTPVFSVIDDGAPWVDANPKETDITYLRTGQRVDITVDSFPDRVFHGSVASVSPGTGAQFAILPPQNAIGNWIKVVQRVPVRVVFDPGQDLSRVRAGMSVNVDIDTGRRRTLASLIGTSTSNAKDMGP